MIRILDSNALIFLRNRNMRVPADAQAYVPPEIFDEFSGDASNDAWVKKCQFLTSKINLAAYLREYASLINRYSDVSFYSLKGLGDVVILASATVLIATHAAAGSLFPETICIVSDDRPLRKFAEKEFKINFALETPEEFAGTL